MIPIIKMVKNYESKKRLVIILTIIVILFILGFGWYYLFKNPDILTNLWKEW